MKTMFAALASVAVVAGVTAANQLGTSSTPVGVPSASTVVAQNTTGTTQNGTTTTTPTTTVPSTTTPTSTAPTTTTPTATTPAAGVPGATGAVTVQNIVEITKLVPAGTTAATAFTVPAGVTLVVTDLVVTNTGTAAVCGGAVNRSGTAATPTTPPTPTTPTTPTSPTNGTTPTNGDAAATTPPLGTTPLSGATAVAGTVTQTDSTVTGPLCVPARTTMTVPLTTGIEFAAGQSVQLLNSPDPADTAPGALGFHLRGVLVTLT